MTAATPEQITIFKQAAAARYLERGVDPRTATYLFDTHMDKVAKELGIRKPLTPGAIKFASAILHALAR